MRDISLSWQKILAGGFSSVDKLLAFLDLPAALGDAQAEKSFKVRVPESFALRMEKGNAEDPLLLQVLATALEMETHAGFDEDPLAELSATKVPGLLHKYHGRVLLTLTGACAVHCRYCFRRHFPYEDNNPGREAWKEALQYISADNSIQEVILSGGDPLLLSDSSLETFVARLNQISHVKTLRFHTRVPVVLPERINESFSKILQKTRLNKVVVLHCNHPNELDNSVYEACSKLKQSGCHLLNQAVLLKKINDNAKVQAELCEKLFDTGILPYYLHVLDKVNGAAHFDLPPAQALSIHKELQALLPGYLVPKLVREEAGKRHKTWLR